MADAVDVLVVGAGITGIYQLYRALENGFSAELVEQGDGPGGTWFWNRYPGARFDSESYTYGYLFSRELWDEWQWQEHFAGQPEIERYLNHVVDRFDLRRHMRFGAAVESAVWDETSTTWTVTVAGVEKRCRFLVSATGVFSVPVYPPVPGREEFAGLQAHTARWPVEPVDFAGSRVAVVGTGSSGVQIVPVIAGEVASLTVFQRSPNWATPLNNRAITDDEQAWLRAEFEQIVETLNTSPAGFLHEPSDRAGTDDDASAQAAFFETMWASPGFTKLTSNYTDLLFDEATNDAWCAFLAGKIRAIVRDPATADALIPTNHRYGDHRPPFVTGYFEAFNAPNVELVSLQGNPMTRVTATGIETADGVLREFDVIVWATGFDFGTGALLRMGIEGTAGTLADAWADGPTTYLGIAAAGFPNLFFPGGPHAAAGNNPRYNGDQADLVTDLLVFARSQGCTRIEVDAAAEESWTAMIDRAANRKPSFGQSSYYFGANIPGKPRKYLLNAAGRPKLLSLAAEQRATDFKAFRLS